MLLLPSLIPEILMGNMQLQHMSVIGFKKEPAHLAEASAGRSNMRKSNMYLLRDCIDIDLFHVHVFIRLVYDRGDGP